MCVFFKSIKMHANFEKLIHNTVYNRVEKFSSARKGIFTEILHAEPTSGNNIENEHRESSL